MILLEDRGLWTFLAVFILLPLLALLAIALTGATGAWTIVLFIIAMVWLGSGVIIGSGFVLGDS